MHYDHGNDLKTEVLVMYTICFVMDHVEVYDQCGSFMYSADTVKEAREMMVE